jgi:hypothetical protein
MNLAAQQILCALALPDCRREIKIADAMVIRTIELEQCFEIVAQVDRRAHNSWSSLSNEWRLRKMEARKQVSRM